MAHLAHTTTKSMAFQLLRKYDDLPFAMKPCAITFNAISNVKSTTNTYNSSAQHATNGVSHPFEEIDVVLKVAVATQKSEINDPV